MGRSAELQITEEDYVNFSKLIVLANEFEQGTMKRAPYVCVCVCVCVRMYVCASVQMLNCYFSVICEPILILFALYESTT